MALTTKLTDAERRAQNNRTSGEILCDHTGCRKVAVEVRVVKEINSKFAVCAEHLNLSAHTEKSKD